MMKTDDTHPIRKQRPDEIFDSRRRTLLIWIPSAILAAISATFTAAAYRFLRPQTREAEAGQNSSGTWAEVAELSALAGDGPHMRKVLVEERAGWSLRREERTVYVLAGEGHQVLSAVCPHEQCEVAWSMETKEFLCPCHDSRFGPEGARLSGPAETDMERLPTRVENGVIQVLINGNTERS